MARLTVEDCLKVVNSRFDLIIMASKRARQLSNTSRDPLVEWDNDKPTLVALREIEAGLLDKETLERTLEEDVLMDGFSTPGAKAAVKVE
ncbi:MAG: DNA-directed RNA polymerase subunit omega [SAR86 cluster bacterium]|jgi:DNA-directed RNA polymerase subunit omega|uniref:DNA-directed RNA polymerase subunit omega n=1 Tax=SAR86 cluster bacterium TaxID=2030880 RepID=A0A937IDN5_9GAMM|nr:DNA-directed RNA polymerase subunit omega [SAR86 cluster bacterium]MDA0976349.1 DNA-directed RNA polymerase subunit omega [Pseudomonadota bacterium]MDA1037507.1 DNA-directed RNA polymerase subunit omega [Pseudomonadota bacterium]